MLRITEIQELDGTVSLRLEGTLSQNSCEDLFRVCAQYDPQRTGLIMLDMSGVVFMSNDAAVRLTALPRERFKLANCSAFVQTLIANVAADQSKTGTGLNQYNGRKAGK